MEDNGWIKLHRKILDNKIWTEKPDKWFKIWMYLLLKANHKSTNSIPRGSFFMKYEWIKQETGATQDQIKHCIGFLVKSKMCATTKATRGFIVSICNYDDYQATEATTKATRTPHARHTEATLYNKNDKNERINTTVVASEEQNQPANDKTEFFALLVDRYNFTNGTKKKKISPETEKNILYWLDYYSEEDIINALENQPNCKLNFYREIEFDTIFRTTGRDKQPVDYIGAILRNYKKESNYGA